MNHFKRSNDAVQVNPPTGASGIYSQEHITTHGSDWLWAAFAFMLFSDLALLVWQFFIPRGQRIFHYLGIIILTTASVAYFSLASDLGFASIATEFGHMGFPVGEYRQIWYVRYIDWVITTPALLLELVLGTGLPLSDLFLLCFFDLVMIITGLVGALVKSSYKWGYFAIGCAALLYIWWILIVPARISANKLGHGFGSSFLKSSILLSVLWMGYPIAWGLCDGGNVISPDSEMIFYGVLDVCAKPLFLFFHLFSLHSLDLSLLQLSSGKSTDSGETKGPTPMGEKRRRFFRGRGHAADDHQTSDTTQVDQNTLAT